MRRLAITVAALTLGSALTLVPDDAHAAGNQFGNNCLATNAVPSQTFVLTGSTGLPAASPINGVLTKATFNVPGAAPPSLPTTVKVIRPTGVANSYSIISQTASLAVPNTVSTFDVRLPVKAGDLVGIYGSAGTLYCNPTGGASDTIAAFAADAGVGSTQTFSPSPAGYGIPLVATVEPDADGDGFGDVTQDLCPQSAAIQTACPTIKLDSLASVSGRKIAVVVASSTSATVSVSGIAKVNGKKVKLKGGSKTVEPGSLTQFKVKLPKALRAALAKLPASKKITVKLTASATNPAGVVTTDSTKVKLPGSKG